MFYFKLFIINVVFLQYTPLEKKNIQDQENSCVEKSPHLHTIHWSVAALTANYIANGKEQSEARGTGGVSESDEFLAPSFFGIVYVMFSAEENVRECLMG